MVRNEQPQALTQAIENYLKAIYEITLIEERASTMGISARLGVKPASVTGMLQKMALTDPPLVEYQKYRGAVLTEKGELAALETIRHHRLLESFLYQILDFGWDEIHDEAEKLEHVVSEELEERIARKLGEPSYDPHGAPIPSRELRMPPFSTTRLLDLKQGEKALIQRVSDENAEVLRYLEKAGLIPGQYVYVEEILPLDGNYQLRIDALAEPVIVGRRIAGMVHVDLVEADQQVFPVQ